jgi:hypothetical protein
MIETVIVIQAFIRGRQSRNRQQKRHISAAIIQYSYRLYVSRKRTIKFQHFHTTQTELDAKLSISRSRKAIKERELQLLSLMSGSRVKTYQTDLEEKAAVTSMFHFFIILVQKNARMWIDQARVSRMRKSMSTSSLKAASNPTRSCWSSELDIDDPSVSYIYHNAGFPEIEKATTKLMNRLFLEQQKRIARYHFAHCLSIP